MTEQTNLIVNGDFSRGNYGWSGNDLETNYREGAYLRNGSYNRVAEMDGHRGEVTSMEQSFQITDPMATEITFDSALRNASLCRAGSEGFTAEVVDSSGVTIAEVDILPTVNTFSSFSLPVTFPSEGIYTLRLTELGRDDSLGAIIDNVELLVCFAGQTRIATPDGPRCAREIRAGDWLSTRVGPRQVRWVGRRKVGAGDLAADHRLRPVRIRAGALGAGLPKADLWVSRQHRMLVSSKIAARMFGCPEALVAAVKLTALPGVQVDSAVQDIEYVHFLFASHHILFAEGAPAESLFLGPQTRHALSPEGLAEVKQLFPGLETVPMPPAQAIPPPHKQTRLALRMARNGALPLAAYHPPSPVHT